MKHLLDSLKALGPARLGAMGAVAIVMLGMLVFLAGGGSHPRMALLYDDLDLHEASQIVDVLDKAHVPHEIGGQGDRILVPASDVLSARLLLAKSGLPSGGSVGYEIFDRSDNLTQTQFEQNINQTRALEGELTRSIALIRGVRSARVHLVLPHRAPFASQTQPAQASVLLSLAGTTRLDPEAAEAIQTLVVAAVPELNVRNVSIIDTRGNVLARPGTPDPNTAAITTAATLRLETEQRLERAVEDMLVPTLGVGNVRAEASVTMDLQQTHETRETFDPDQQVLRSQKTLSDKTRNTEASATTSVANNLPNANAGQTPNGAQGDREEETNNYEIGKTVRTIVNSEPRIGRLTVSVVVNGSDLGEGGKWKPRAPAELEQISSLVKNAIGFDARRGDAVTVVSMRFADPAPTGLSVEKVAPGKLLSLGNPDLLRLLQTAVLGVFVLLALLLVIRPTMLRLATPRYPAAHAALTESGAMTRIASPQAAATIAQGLATPPTTDADGELGDGMINLTRVEGQLRASSIRQLGDLVRRHPMESLNIVRNWIGHEAG